MPRNRAIAILLLFFAASLFQSGRWALPVAAWIAPAIGLYVIHRLPARRGYLLLLLATYAALLLGWRGIVPFPFPIFPIFMLANAIIGCLPFLADRLLRRRLGDGVANTLVFPIVGTAVEFLTVGSGPLGSFGASAYTQSGLPAMGQLASVAGLWGITFVMAWLASVLYWIIDRAVEKRPVLPGVITGALLLLLALGWGGWRQASAYEPERMVTVAGITTEHTDMASLMPLFREDRAAFRSIENGMTILRHSDDGFSRVIDPYGRTVAEEDYIGAEASFFVAEAPIGRVPSLYPALGDAVGWASVAGQLLLAGIGLLEWWRGRRGDSVSEAGG